MWTSSLLHVLAATSAFASLSVAAPTKEPDWLTTSLEIHEDAPKYGPIKGTLSFKLQRPENKAPDSCTVQWMDRVVPTGWQTCGDNTGSKTLSYMINAYRPIDRHMTLDITVKEWFIAHSNVEIGLEANIHLIAFDNELIAADNAVPEGQKMVDSKPYAEKQRTNEIKKANPTSCSCHVEPTIPIMKRIV